MDEYRMYIDGKWVTSAQTMAVLNPATEEAIATVPIASSEQVQQALEAARRAQRDWARLTGVERGNFLRRWADLVDRDHERLARLLSEEQGKPLAEARGEMSFGNSWFRYYAEFDRRIEGDI
ncbi:MAG TPA: aldehyde dehydrogenase family protein, partial [Chthonomonadales bacterium]|nr:aldehyde dehydrogenase family protein [Chthonomonadales bacterium]